MLVTKCRKIEYECSSLNAIHLNVLLNGALKKKRILASLVVQW